MEFLFSFKLQVWVIKFEQNIHTWHWKDRGLLHFRRIFEWNLPGNEYFTLVTSSPHKWNCWVFFLCKLMARGKSYFTWEYFSLVFHCKCCTGIQLLAIMSYMAIKRTLSVIIPDFQNNAKPINEPLSLTKSLDLKNLNRPQPSSNDLCLNFKLACW